MDQTFASNILSAFAHRKVAVLGDYYLDEYLYCGIRGVSPEMPVVRMRAQRRDHRAGAAGNLACNLSGLGAEVTALGVVGADAAGAELKRLLSTAGVAVDFLSEDADRGTGVLSRLLASKSENEEHHHHARVDYEPSGPLSRASADELRRSLRACLENVEALFLADYDENIPPVGVLNPPLAGEAVAVAREAGVPVYASSRRRPAELAGADCLICNEHEALLLGFAPRGCSCESAQETRRKLGLKTLCVTLGRLGVVCADESGVVTMPIYTPAGAPEIVDVCGAGDTFGAALLLARLSDAKTNEALELAGIAAALAVRKDRTEPVSASEVLREIRYPGMRSEKLLGVDELAGLVDDVRSGKRVVFTNGCFDLFHAGHVHLLRRAKAFGDVLVVAINSDRSTAENKGAGRPVLCERDRIEILTSLDFVDYVTVFDELTPINLLRRIRPHVLVKGGDYAPEEVVGRDIVCAYGGEVKIVEYQGETTTSLIRSIKAASDGTRQS